MCDTAENTHIHTKKKEQKRKDIFIYKVCMICKVKRGGNQGSDRKDPNKQTKRRGKAKSCTTHSRKHTKHTRTHTPKGGTTHKTHAKDCVTTNCFPLSLSRLQCCNCSSDVIVRHCVLQPPSCAAEASSRSGSSQRSTKHGPRQRDKERKKLFSLPGTRIDFLTRFG